MKKQVCCLLLGISILCLPAQQVFAAPPSPAGPAAQAEEKAEGKKPHEKPKPHEKVKPHEAKKPQEEKIGPGPLGEKPVPPEPKENPVPPEPKEKPVPPHEKKEEELKPLVTERLPVAEQTVVVPTVVIPKEEANSSDSQNSTGAQEQESVKETEVNETEVNETKKDAADSSLRQEVVNYALRFVGNPYKWGGTSLTNGADCSGFVQSVYAHFGYSISRTSGGQAGSTGYAEVALKESDLLPGDLIFYANNNGTVYHVALYIGDGRIVHAANSKEGITISQYTYMKPYKARRIIEL